MYRHSDSGSREPIDMRGKYIRGPQADNKDYCQLETYTGTFLAGLCSLKTSFMLIIPYDFMLFCIVRFQTKVL